MKSWLISLCFIIIFSCKKENNDYYEIVPVNDSISKIIWGNDTFKNSAIFRKEILNKDHIFSVGNNKDYIVIQNVVEKSKIGLIMPMKKGSKLIILNNIIGFDKKNSLVAMENPFNDKNPILIQNLKTGKKLFVGSNLPVCQQENKLDCFHPYGSFQFNKFYFKWSVWPYEFIEYNYDITSLL